MMHLFANSYMAIYSFLTSKPKIVPVQGMELCKHVAAIYGLYV